MFFQRIKTPGIAHNAYLIGSEGVGILIDPRRDVDEYLQLAALNGLKIGYILETHRQEDFVLGSASLRDRTGAKIVAAKNKLSGHADIYLADAEEIKISNFRICGYSTPGHTPESMSYAFYLDEAPERCWAVFTGDALFIGETGRTDLTNDQKTAENAELLYDSIHAKILPLGDQTLLYPAHGSGSVCGGNIAKYDESTVGLERTYNPVFVLSRDAFVESKVHERLPRPPYFRLMERLNLKGGTPVVGSPQSVPALSPKEFAERCVNGIIIDTRLPEAFAGGHIPGSFSIWLAGLPVFSGWTAKSETPIYLVLERASDIEEAFLHLSRVGIDHVAGFLSVGFESWRNEGRPIEKTGAITPLELKGSEGDMRVIDVREISEFEDSGHTEKASHVYVGHINQVLSEKGELPFSKEQPLVVTCSVGHRASLAVSVLRQHGYQNVSNLLGGMTAWKKLGYPLKKGATSADLELEFGKKQTRESEPLSGDVNMSEPL